jgi:hypothetical protein
MGKILLDILIFISLGMIYYKQIRKTMKKYIIKFKIAKRNFYRKWLQKAADKITIKAENSKNYEEFELWYSLGTQVDITAKFQNIYLK